MYRLKNDNSKGNGAANISGLEFCRENNYEISVILDVDEQHNPKYIYQFIKSILKNQVDFTIGNHFNFFYDMNPFKNSGSKLQNILYFL